MLALRVAVVLIYLTSCLTSGAQVNDNVKENGDIPSGIRKLFGDSSTEIKTPAAVVTATRSIGNDENANVSKTVNQPRSLAEGNPVIKLAETELKSLIKSTEETAVAEGVSLPVKNLTLAFEAKTGTVSRKSPEPKVVARKGAIYTEELTNQSESKAQNDEPPIVANSGVTKMSTKLAPIVTEETPSMMTNDKEIKKLNNTEPGIKIDIAGNKSIPLVILVPSQVNSSIVKHKPKPTATITEDDDDQRIPPSPTQKPLLGMPRKIDYIVPIVITVMAVPLLAIGAFVLYKRSKDCWDRRHYRRMDFLIDGMYND